MARRLEAVVFADVRHGGHSYKCVGGHYEAHAWLVLETNTGERIELHAIGSGHGHGVAMEKAKSEIAQQRACVLKGWRPT